MNYYWDWGKPFLKYIYTHCRPVFSTYHSLYKLHTCPGTMDPVVQNKAKQKLKKIRKLDAFFVPEWIAMWLRDKNSRKIELLSIGFLLTRYFCFWASRQQHTLLAKNFGRFNFGQKTCRKINPFAIFKRQLAPEFLVSFYARLWNGLKWLRRMCWHFSLVYL